MSSFGNASFRVATDTKYYDSSRNEFSGRAIGSSSGLLSMGHHIGSNQRVTTSSPAVWTYQPALPNVPTNTSLGLEPGSTDMVGNLDMSGNVFPDATTVVALGDSSTTNAATVAASTYVTALPSAPAATTASTGVGSGMTVSFVSDTVAPNIGVVAQDSIVVQAGGMNYKIGDTGFVNGGDDTLTYVITAVGTAYTWYSYALRFSTPYPANQQLRAFVAPANTEASQFKYFVNDSLNPEGFGPNGEFILNISNQSGTDHSNPNFNYMVTAHSNTDLA